jgi:hypothetical protein
MKLKRVDIFQAKTIRGATKIPTELRYRIEVRLLRRRRQIADRHVLDHAAAKRADLSHRKTSCLKGWARKTQDPFRQGGDCDRPLTAAQAASFNPETQENRDPHRLSCKIDYFLRPNHGERSIASKFFTDDEVSSDRRVAGGHDCSLGAH